ncbi:type II toxin-antitoxin system VapC family toxin [Chroococcidiopsis sp. CCNUC1]|uniref:type II toxin-antitoxin system VapC family toxin n=1 Tax=Chroococcidiopsis sp. CCNUC1 TaxID=2653189 RepID=UPI002020901E|nr:type II toxin-antitoxin system VapC family toxin [Chroococcidiopsis sp. CCNUC1]URD53812.1 type II toxin-antitoxin system VapC family toxin [Chroococcidiopsis sp. CCNUC1]
MLLVVDSNVVAKWFFPEELQQQALALQSDWMAGTVDLVAPDLILTEVSSITWNPHYITSGIAVKLEVKARMINTSSYSSARVLLTN